jgi:predicted N-acetyltransferase YhbS
MGEDLRLRETDAAGATIAEVALWWTQAPPLAGERLGFIGSFSATSETATVAVLRRAAAELRVRGCTLAVGPMDGNTWRRYRLVTEPGNEPPFFLEPTNPAEWPAWWRAAGFGPLAEYYSTATDDLAAQDARLDAVALRMAAAGVTIRPLDPARFEEELEKIYAVSVVSFQQNYLYTPLPKEAFVAQYRAIQARVRPELVLLAEQAGRPVGYLFATPDYAQAQRGGAVTTVIVKTLAVLPGRAYAGLGALLMGEAHAAGRRLGFTRAIHALMHESNKVRNLSAIYARTIRRYTLFAKRLNDPPGGASGDTMKIA